MHCAEHDLHFDESCGLLIALLWCSVSSAKAAGTYSYTNTVRLCPFRISPTASTHIATIEMISCHVWLIAGDVRGLHTRSATKPKSYKSAHYRPSSEVVLPRRESMGATNLAYLHFYWRSARALQRQRKITVRSVSATSARHRTTHHQYSQVRYIALCA